MPVGQFEIPALATLSVKPSWVNRAGNVDRSGCFEVRASELWRQIPPAQWTAAPRLSGREAFAEITVTARMLRDLHDTRPPQELIGDWRTHKSNVMRSDQFPRNPPRKDDPILFTSRHGDLNRRFASNPNKGATRTKKLGLWGAGQIGFPDRDWEQVVRVERWDRKRSAISRQRSAKRVDRHIATSPPHQIPTHQHFLICPDCNKKMLKLMMVLASEQEIGDAEIAEGWVRMIDAHPLRDRLLCNDSELGTRYSELVTRYGPLFRGRHLRCRNCLGVRYGEVRRERREHATRQVRRRRTA